MSTYRPWGDLRWMHEKATVPQWGLISCLGAEERSLSSLHLLKAKGALGPCRFLNIQNPAYDNIDNFEDQRSQIRKKFAAIGGNGCDVRDFVLMESTHFDIVDFVETEAVALGDSVLLDISVLPKRFFYPILRLLVERLKAGLIKNLAVSYAIPIAYSNEKLAWNHDEWGPLPLYKGRYSRRKVDKIIAGIGFETHGLLSQLEKGKGASGIAVLLLPFPSSLRWVTRCWDTAEKIVRARGEDFCEIVCCDAHDISQAFEQMETLSNFGQREVLLAPYGPKTLSLAIALFAAKYDYPAFYTQPRIYNHKYSEGVQIVDGLPFCLGYLIGIGGRYLYG
jgi:hypothetical protein